MQHITETPLIKSVVHDNFRFDFYGYWPCKIVQDEEGKLYLETAHMNKVAFIDTETGKRWYSTGSRYAASWEAGVDVMIPMRRPVIEPYTRKIVDVNVIEQDNFVEIIGGAGFAYEHSLYQSQYGEMWVVFLNGDGDQVTRSVERTDGPLPCKLS